MPASAAKSSAKPAASPGVEAPPLAPGAAPLCYVVDEDASIRHFLALVLHGSGIDSVEFADGAALRQTAEERVPDLIFHNIALDSGDAIEFDGRAWPARICRYRATDQQPRRRGARACQKHRRRAQAHMLPVLKKPYETEAIGKIIRELKLGCRLATANIELEQALANKWIEFWYQPKIDLRKKRLAGAEAYAAPAIRNTARPDAQRVHAWGGGSDLIRTVGVGLGQCAKDRRRFFPSSASISRSPSTFTPTRSPSCRSRTSSRRTGRAPDRGPA